MKTGFLIILIIACTMGIISTAHAQIYDGVMVPLDRTVYPILNPDPLDLWNSAEVIFDGTVIEAEYIESQDDNDIVYYKIKVNEYFKVIWDIKLIHAQQNSHAQGFDVGDNGLFYIEREDVRGYVVQPYSVQTFGNCNARDLIEISPVLPSEGFPRGAPTRSESYFDPCMADYFTYDPDFFGGIHNGISPLQQKKHGIPNDMVRCYDDLIKITKHDDSPICVTSETHFKLLERGWMAISSNFETQREIAKEIFKSLRIGENTSYTSFGLSNDKKSLDLYFDKTAFTFEKNEVYYQEFIDEAFAKVAIPINVIFVEGKDSGDE